MEILYPLLRSLYPKQFPAVDASKVGPFKRYVLDVGNSIFGMLFDRIHHTIASNMPSEEKAAQQWANERLLRAFGNGASEFIVSVPTKRTSELAYAKRAIHFL